MFKSVAFEINISEQKIKFKPLDDAQIKKCKKILTPLNVFVSESFQLFKEIRQKNVQIVEVLVSFTHYTCKIRILKPFFLKLRIFKHETTT